MLCCPQCDREMTEVMARANPGTLIQLDQCRRCGGIWCDKWELFPIDAAEAERLDGLDENLLRAVLKLPEKTLYCPRCADELSIFSDPLLPAEIQLRRCARCDGIWLNRGHFRRYKDYQRRTRKQKLGREEIAVKLPEVYADPRSWVVTGTGGIFAYPSGEEENHEIVRTSLANSVKLVLQGLARMILGV